MGRPSTGSGGAMERPVPPLVAIHKTVLYSPDRRIRITADPGGSVFTVERDLVFVGRFSNTAALETWLAEQGLTLADLLID